MPRGLDKYLMPEISVIILTYNSKRYIKKLIESLLLKYKAEVNSGKLEIIVADNKSSDDTLKIARNIKQIKIVENNGNFGFAKGINLAAGNARGDFLLFINPDTVFVQGDIFSLKEKFEDEKIAAVGGKIINTFGKRELSCGKFYNLFNLFFLSVGLEEKMGIRFSPKKDRYVDSVSGGFMMVKNSLWKKLGGFDENFFMYIEDSELCFRIKKIGKKVFFSNSATIEHVGQGSSNRTFAVVNIYKGLLYFHKKHMGFFSYCLAKFLLLLKAAVLVMVGKMSDNQYLYRTYSEAIKTSI